MAEQFTARLVNPPFEDPGLLISFRWEKRAILFDLGNVERLGAGTLVRVTEVFVSHAHVDHFIGFDQLLRVILARNRRLRIYGPKGIIDQVAGKLAGYTWNLTEDYPLVIEVTELEDQTLRTAAFRAQSRFKPEMETGNKPFTGVLLSEDEFQVRSAILDHGIPCLAFSLIENKRFNVRKDALDSLGVRAGPWLTRLKDLIRKGAPNDLIFQLGTPSDGGPLVSLGALKAQLLRVSDGMRISYVVDAAPSESNQQKIVDLARGSDLFFCEAPFLDRDRELATVRRHLTAAHAGKLARIAGVKGFVPFHFSPRYRSTPHVLMEEAMTEASQKPPGIEVCHASTN